MVKFTGLLGGQITNKSTGIPSLINNTETSLSTLTIEETNEKLSIFVVTLHTNFINVTFNCLNPTPDSTPYEGYVNGLYIKIIVDQDGARVLISGDFSSDLQIIVGGTLKIDMKAENKTKEFKPNNYNNRKLNNEFAKFIKNVHIKK